MSPVCLDNIVDKDIFSSIGDRMYASIYCFAFCIQIDFECGIMYLTGVKRPSVLGPLSGLAWKVNPDGESTLPVACGPRCGLASKNMMEAHTSSECF